MGYRKQKGGLISGIIGGIVGGIEGQKHPVQDIRSGGRKQEAGQTSGGGSGGYGGSGHGQESGHQQMGQSVNVPGEGLSHTAGSSASSGKNEHAPPPYEPRQQ